MNEKHGAACIEAVRMVDIFASVGVWAFDLTLTDIDQQKQFYRAAQAAGWLKQTMPARIRDAQAQQHSVILRPISKAGVFLIQLDDLDAAAIKRVKAAAFMTLATSPGNFQAWVAVAGRFEDKDFPRRVRKAARADPSASGATRVAGTANFKRKYAPDFPMVAIASAAPGLTVTPAGLDAMGLVASREIVKARPLQRASGTRRWPSYKMCLDRAPESHSRPGMPRDSIADFVWCMTAISWGHSIENTAARLMQESGKARENGQRYAMMTATNAAAAAVDRRRPATFEPG